MAAKKESAKSSTAKPKKDVTPKRITKQEDTKSMLALTKQS